MQNLIRFALFLAGAGLIGILIYKSGPEAVWQTIATLGPYAPLALIPYGFVYLLDTMGWRTSFPKTIRDSIGFWKFGRIRWAGEATNYVIPTAYVGGEALKVYLLSQLGATATQGATSAVTSKTCQTIAQVIFLACGAILAYQHLPSESPLRLGMGLIAVLAVVAIVCLIGIQHFGFYRIIAGLSQKLGIARRFFSERSETIQKVDDQIRAFYRKTPRQFYLCTAFYLGGWLADTVEIWLISHLVESPISWTQALAIEAFIGVAKILGMFVPGSIGVQESGVVLLCKIFGLPIVFGTSYALLRRAREILYASIGWTLLYFEFPSWDALQAKLKQLKREPEPQD